MPNLDGNPFLVSLHISAEINPHYSEASDSDDEATMSFKERFDRATKTIVDRLNPDRVVDAHSKDDMIKAVEHDPIPREWGPGEWQLTPRSQSHDPHNTALVNTSSGHSAGSRDSEETERDNNETNHTQRRKLEARQLRSLPMNLVLPMIDTLHQTMHYSEENIHRHIKDWYEYSASQTEQNQFDTQSEAGRAYRETLIQTFGEQMKAQEKLIDDLAKHCALIAHRAYGQARQIAESVVETILEPEERIQFNNDTRVQTRVKIFIFNRLVMEPPLDGNPSNDKENAR